MTAMVIFIEKKQKYSFWKNPITKSKKSKQNVIFQLCQFSIFFDENFMDWSLG